MCPIKRYNNYLWNQNVFYSLLILFVTYIPFYIVWTTSYFLLFENYDIAFIPTPNETILTKPLPIVILFPVIIDPFFETLTCQYALFYGFSLINWFNNRRSRIIWVAALLFGILHFYSISYMVYNFFMGMWYMYIFIVKQHKKPLLTTYLFHALHNLFVYFMTPVECAIFG